MMSSLAPSRPATLAAAVVDTLVIASDPKARQASIFYWERGRAHTLAVLDAIDRVDDRRTRELAARLTADSADPAVYHELKARLAESRPSELFELAWLAECNSRLGFHLGPDYRAAGHAVSAEALRELPPRPGLSDDVDAPVLVVVPFRDHGVDGHRLRNLLACLISLRDQSASRETYRVVVVETDETPRRRDVIAPYADHYLFAPNPGLFNKSWAVNVGVVHAPGAPEVICVLDADVLVDREFVARNAARFRRPGTMGHLSYRDMWCLDEPSTAWAIEQRLGRHAPEVDVDHLRAFVLRRPPGCCVWARSSAYHRIGGMDERFEGWGGEDNDFAYRMDTNSAFDSHDDLLLHMHHPSSAVLRADGELINAHIPALSWPADAEIGDIGRFVTNTFTTGEVGAA